MRAMMTQPVDLPSLLEDERMDRINEDLRLICKKNGLTFGTDAYLLAAFTRPQPNARCADLGSGTGVLPLLLLAREKVHSVDAVEVQEPFADLIRRNAALNGFADRIRVHTEDVRRITAETLGGEVDLVLSNPPYMRADCGKRNESDAKYIARHEVCGGISDFCAAAGRVLRYGGRFLCVWRPDRLCDLTVALRSAGLEPKRMQFVHADTASEPCIVLVDSTKGAAPSLRVAPPLFLYEPARAGDKTRTLTTAAEQIYATGSFPEA